MRVREGGGWVERRLCVVRELRENDRFRVRFLLKVIYIYIGFFFFGNFTFILNGSSLSSGSRRVLQKPEPASGFIFKTHT